MRSLLFGLGLSMALSTFGCSSSDSGTAAVSAEQACTDYAAAVCDKLSSCISIYVAANLGDIATCNTRYKNQCLGNTGAPSTSLTGNAIAGCAAAAKTASCNDLLDNKLPEACLPKAGGLADGQACGDDNQCKSAFCGFNDGSKICGVCTAAPGAGAACADGSKCGPGLKCSTSKKCAAAVAAGGACDADKPCGVGSTCVSGTCAKWLGEGASCTSGTTADCDTFQSLFCLNNKCVKFNFTADAGGVCGAEVDMASKMVTSVTACTKKGTCKNIDMKTFKGTCAAAAADGAACGGTNGDCIPPAVCVDSVCKLPNPASCK
ncbi:MAG: hypothetical protein ACXWUG_10055 [Polyangiales bacterium]